MSFELLNETARLYPLYSDMENSDIENHTLINTNKLTVPSPIQRRRNLRNSSSYISRNYEQYKHMMQRRINNRRNNTNRRFNTNSININPVSPYSPYNTHSIYRYNTYINKNNNRINNNLIHTHTPTNNNTTINTNRNTKTKIPSAITNTKRRHQKQKKQKRRIRTFYSKKWGNKLYGLTKHYPIITPNTTTTTTTTINQPPNMCINSPHSLSAFIEEETLDLNDIKSTRSPSPSVPIYNSNHLNIDYRFNNENYDSCISNIAANTHTDHDNDSDNEIINDRNNNFKIIISSPNIPSNYHPSNRQEIERQFIMNRRRKRSGRMAYLSSDNEDSNSEDFSSSEDEEYNGNSNFDRNMFEKSSLFLANNNMNVGVYSDFNYSDQSDTDYLSAQSGDFDELTICYHNQKGKNKKNKNIKFRDNYLSDIGPSDIGSSDTEYFSSADSIPSSIPDSIPDSIPQLQTL